MRKIIQFQIYKGDKYYVADGVNVPVVTQGETLDDLQENIKEAVSLYLQDESLISLGLAPEPSILVNFEINYSSATA